MFRKLAACVTVLAIAFAAWAEKDKPLSPVDAIKKVN